MIQEDAARPRRLLRYGAWLLIILVVLVGAVGLWTRRDRLRPPSVLYTEALRADPSRAAALYDTLAARMPELEEYGRLWAAEARLPSLDALEALHAITRYRPDSPAAWEAHVALARYYAGIESPETVKQYRAALAIDNRADIGLELARYLEEQNAPASAYAQYAALLGSDYPDAFAGMRRTASDELRVAADLLARHFCSDVLDILRQDARCEAHRLRAEALVCLGRGGEAADERQLYTACSAAPEPSPTKTLSESQGTEANTIEQAAAATDRTASDQEEAEAGWGGETVPLVADDPVVLWTSTWEMEEQGRLAEALAAYLHIADSDSYVADDAAYRAWVVAHRLGDAQSAGKAMDALLGQGPSWLAWRASGQLNLVLAPDYPQDAVDALTKDVLAKVGALEALGRSDLAYQELRLTALVSETPEVILRMGQELLARGHVQEAYSLGQTYLSRHPYAPRAFWRLAYPHAHANVVAANASAYGLDTALLWAVMRRESAFAVGVSSSAGARGLMQLMPNTQREVGQTMGMAYSPGDAFTPEANIRLGAQYLSQMLAQQGGDLELALMAYNAGPGAIGEWLQDPQLKDRNDLLRFVPYGETREYVERVGLDYLIYRQIWAD